jgi:hypothetical protein
MVTCIMAAKQPATTTGRPRSIGESHSIHGALSSVADESILPGWLNAAKGTASYGRVINILKLIERTEESIKEASARGAYIHVFKRGAPRKWPKEKLQLQRTANEIHMELERALERYLFHVRLTKIISDRWLFNIYCPRQTNDFGWETSFSRKASEGETILQVPTYRVFEGDAVLAVIRLTERSLISRIRVCATCSQKWLFAKHSNYRFCSPACRERYYMRTEEYRAKKAIQMRQYRAGLLRKQEAEKHASRRV